MLRDIDLTGVRAIVTGATSGIGIETARALTAAGADVTLAVRNATAGEAVAEQIAAVDRKDPAPRRPARPRRPGRPSHGSSTRGTTRSTC